LNRSLAEAVVAVLARPSNGAAEQLATFPPREWRSSMNWLFASGLSLHLLLALQELRAESVLPLHVAADLQSAYVASAVRTEALFADVLQLNRSFYEGRLPFVNWKGFALVPQFSPDVRLRPLMDFDFIINADDAGKFDERLRNAGYQVCARTSVETVYEKHRGAFHSVNQIYRPNPYRRVELHMGSDVIIPGLQMPSFAGLLDRARVEQRRGQAFPVLCPEDAFLTHAAHIVKHVLSGSVRLCWLLELMTFVGSKTRSTKVDEHVRLHVGDKHLVWPIVGIALAVANAVFPTKVPSEFEPAIEAIPKSAARWVRLHARTMALSDPFSKLSLLLVREFMDAAQWKSYERSRVFPLRKAPRLVQAKTDSASGRVRSVWTQAQFLTRVILLHIIENARYLLARRKWSRSEV
jgi:Uncharacterised nucleotidyltransferase